MNNADIIEYFMPETCIQQVKNGMLCAADVQVNRQPVFQFFGICKCFIIVRVDESQVIPAAACPLRHSICLTASFDSVFSDDLHPVLDVGTRWFTCAGWFYFI